MLESATFIYFKNKIDEKPDGYYLTDRMCTEFIINSREEHDEN